MHSATYYVKVTPNYGIKLAKKYRVGIPAKMEKGRFIKEPSAQKKAEGKHSVNNL